MQKYFRGSTAKDSVSYTCNEEIKFELELVCEGRKMQVPLFKWEITADDGTKASGFKPGESGKIELTTKIAKPGFVHVIVTACALDGSPINGIDKFEGGAGAEIDKIEQGVDDPEDYDEFWAKQVEIVKSTEPETLYMQEVDSGNPDYVSYDVRIKAPGDMPTSAILTMPKNAKPGSLAGQVRFHGYGFSQSSILCEENTAVLWMNIHGFDNFREQSYYDEFAKTHGGFGFNKEENQSPETCYFKNVILRDLQGVRWLEQIPEYDGKGITCAGGSMGAMQAINVAAHIDNPKSLDVFIPWLCDLGGITKGRLRGWRPDLEPAVRYFDTAAAAKRVKCPAKIACGLGDYVCPPSGEVVLWHNFAGEKSIRFIQNMTHPYRPVEIVEYSR